jgi:hypothetical protein
MTVLSDKITAGRLAAVLLALALAACTASGGAGSAAAPWASTRSGRPADQYLTGWTRDFITVLAPG